MALFSAMGPSGDGWRSFQFTFTTHPRIAVGMYCAGGSPSRSSRPCRTGLSGPLGAVVPGDDGATLSGVDGHVPRRLHLVAWGAAWCSAPAGFRPCAGVLV